MEIIIKFRKPSKRMIWQLKRLDRWLDRHILPLLSMISNLLLLGGFIVLMGVVGSIEYGDAITGLHIRLVVGALFAWIVGVGIAVYVGVDEEE